MAASLEESQRRGRIESRVTLRNYLDMSRSLNLEPGKDLKQKNNRPPMSRSSLQRLDMSKSLNVEPGFLRSASHMESVPEDALDDLSIAKHRSSRRNSQSVPGSERVSNASAADASSLFQPGFKNRVLPTSPNLVDTIQEQQLIDAFVDQLKNIATSSNSTEQNRRRAVRRALEYPPPEKVGAAKPAKQKVRLEVPVVAVTDATSSLYTKPKKPEVTVVSSRSLVEMDHHKVEVCPTLVQACKTAAAASSNGGVVVVDTSRMNSKTLRNLQRQQHQQQQRRSLPRVEEKQTVISSPISHNALTTPAFKMRLKSADMAPAIQQHAVERTVQLLKGMDKLNCRLVASQLKKDFDKMYGPAWHCIVGTSFGSYVTHSVGGFIYFAVGKVSILLFRTAIQVVQKQNDTTRI